MCKIHIHATNDNNQSKEFILNKPKNKNIFFLNESWVNNYIQPYNRIIKLSFIDCDNQISEIWCSNSNLIELDIPQGVKVVNCHRNNLNTLKIPQSLISISCENNNIKELNFEQGSKIQDLTCDKIKINRKLPYDIEFI